MARAKNLKQVSTVREAPIEDPGRAPRTPPEAKERRNGAGAEDPNAQPPGDDRVYGVASRARWGDSGSDIHTLTKETREIESGKPDAEEEEEEEEEETSSADDLTVQELKDALDEAEVAYPANAKKGDLVKLYRDNGLE